MVATTTKTTENTHMSTKSCVVEAGFNIALWDIPRQCSRQGAAPYAPCSANSTDACMARCARRASCFVAVYSSASRLCWLKSSSAAYKGVRVRDADASLGLCAERSERTIAVCVVGQLRAAGAIPSIREHGV